jgi:hypothetical protein
MRDLTLNGEKFLQLAQKKIKFKKWLNLKIQVKKWQFFKLISPPSLVIFFNKQNMW